MILTIIAVAREMKVVDSVEEGHWATRLQFAGSDVAALKPCGRSPQFWCLPVYTSTRYACVLHRVSDGAQILIGPPNQRVRVLATRVLDDEGFGPQYAEQQGLFSLRRNIVVRNPLALRSYHDLDKETATIL